jgi:hypothetical protein
VQTPEAMVIPAPVHRDLARIRPRHIDAFRLLPE